jgi:hypothetical protein
MVRRLVLSVLEAERPPRPPSADSPLRPGRARQVRAGDRAPFGDGYLRHHSQGSAGSPLETASGSAGGPRGRHVLQASSLDRRWHRKNAAMTKRKVTAPQHKSSQYRAAAKRVRAAANGNPFTRCWRCGNTLDKCGPRGDGRNRNGTPCTWHAGHLVESSLAHGLLPECSHCNTSSGARFGNAKRVEPHSEIWWKPEPREPWP